jgi:hypothetical protein
MMENRERAAAPRNRRLATWMVTLGVVAAVGIAVITAGVIAASRGHATPSRADTAGQGKHSSAGVMSDPLKTKRSDSIGLQLQDLPHRPDLGDWAETVTTGRGSALACVPAHVTDGIGAQSVLERRFVARTATGGDTGPYAARIGETVLQFADHAAAADAVESVQSWLQDCTGPDLVKHELNASEGDAGLGSWEVLLRSAQDFCGGTECDAVWFDREGFFVVGDRLVLVSMEEVGGPLEPDGLAASMHDLVDNATKAAA